MRVPPGKRKITSKVLLLGAQGVGKTSILLRQTGDGFNDKLKSTIGASFSQSTVELPDASVHLQIWDTAGQERFRSLVTMYYRNAAAAVLVYDLSDNTSFLQLKSWVEELNRNVSQPVVYCLLANKLDLADDSREVPTRLGEEFAKSIDAIFFETSAKSDEGIGVAFQALGIKLYHTEMEKQRTDLLNVRNNDFFVADAIDVTAENVQTKKKCC